jgi:mRNA interferase RelE/StbE
LAWRIELSGKALKTLEKLDREEARRILQFLRERIAREENPRRLGKPLQGTQEFWRYRVGDYRLLCTIEDQRITVVVLRIGHRREVYR